MRRFWGGRRRYWQSPIAVLVGVVFVVAATWPSRAPQSYAGAFTDFDLLLTAIAADLTRYRELTGQPSSSVLDSINAVAVRIYQKGVVRTPDRRWLFEPGAWDNHPDYRYSGATHKGASGISKPARNIVEDASHFSQVPLWLNSERLAATDSARRNYFSDLEAGLCRQFFYAVVVRPEPPSRSFRFNNYMDGRNGLYRINYQRRGAQWGYGPFELGSTVFNGWWAFLGSSDVGSLYDSLTAAFPYAPLDVDIYAGPTQARAMFADGRYQLLTALAAGLASGRQASPSQQREQNDVWARQLAPQLRRDLWSGSSAEGAQYLLMVPLHVAFIENRAAWQREFAQHFARFAVAGREPSSAPLIGELHYLYFASRFLVLAEEAGARSIIPNSLASLIEGRITALWLNAGTTISQTGWGEPAFHDFQSYEQWKLGLSRRYSVTADNSPDRPGQLPSSCDRPRPISAIDRADRK